MRIRALALLFVVLFASVALSRVWTSRTGKTSQEADFVGVEEGKVRLKKPNGKTVLVPRDQLSDADQEFVAKQLAKQPALKQAPAPPEKPGAAKPAPAKAQPPIQTFKELERAALQCRTAAEALALYTDFAKRVDVAEPERGEFEKRLAFWKDAAAKKLIRFGTKWVTVEQRRDARKDAKRLIEQAWELVAIGSNDGARVKLIEASRTDPEGIDADFTLGLLNAIAARHTQSADKHFSECVRRSPRHVSSLNNLALSKMRSREYDLAIRHWTTALTLAPATPEVVHNIGRLLACANTGKIRLPKDRETKFNELFLAGQVLPDAPKYDPACGWLYMPLYSAHDEADDEEPEENAPPAPPAEKQPKAPAALPLHGQRLVIGNGSGFVVQKEYILTNRHVAAEGDGFTIVHPISRKRMPATKVAVSRTRDLALLRCPGLDAAPLPLNDGLARLGTEVMVLGFPAATRLGVQVKATRGSISSEPSRGTDDMFLLDAIANPGNSGGPIVDDRACVVGVLTAMTVTERLNYVQGVTSKDALEFVKRSLPDFVAIERPEAGRPWPDVAATARESTTLVLIERNVLPIPIPAQVPQPPLVPRRGDGGFLPAPPLEDWSCLACNATGRRPCPRGDCANGKVPSTTTRVVGRHPVTGQEIVEKSKIRVACPTCGGRGTVDCRLCNEGSESPRFRGIPR